jgi:uncharacterized oxidoreductase
MHPTGMKVTGNTIFITGGGSGIGRGLAEALHAAGNQVIISGRRKEKLADVTQANAGMDSIELDLENTASIAAAAKTLTQMYPKLNVLVHKHKGRQIKRRCGYGRTFPFCTYFIFPE